MNSIYLDWAATAPPDTDIIIRAQELAAKNFANPSSPHGAGIAARKLLENARARCAKALGAPADRIVFCSGGTEADHFPFLSLLLRPAPGSIAVGAIEHAAIKNQAAIMESLGWKIIHIQPNKRGIIEPDSVIRSLRGDTMLVALASVNNETGAIQPIDAIAEALNEYGKTQKKPSLHADCVQALGKIQSLPKLCAIDSAAFSAHKIGGPRGCGILYTNGRMEPFLRGGGQERGLRAGTENLAGALAFAECVEKYAGNAAEYERVRSLCARMADEIASIPGCTIIPRGRSAWDADFSPYIIQAAIKDIPGEITVRALSAKGVYISTGSACSSKKKERPVLEAMGVPAKIARAAVRFSFGRTTAEADIDAAAAAIRDLVNSF